VLASTPEAVRVSAVGSFVDIDLPISDISEEPGLVRITARGLADGIEIGLEVDFPSPRKGQSGPRTLLPLSSAQIRSIGAASDNFVAFLAKRYRLPSLASAMVRSVKASVVGLEGDPGAVLRAPTKTKFFFFDSGPEDRYAEVFLNVDSTRHTLQFHEKDEEYRRPLLLALTKAP
jgi:hypothetical protein